MEEPILALVDQTGPVLDGAAANEDAGAAPAETHQFRFTGSGGEYFKIWIVNLCLTIVTLGIYSAWAKVRRLQYFDRNTGLAGAVFDFDGNPKAILRGRMLALALVGAYQYAFGFSFAVGMAVVLALLAGLPFMMRGALRFRLRNTRYRGLHFHFTGAPAGAYAAYLPPLLVFLLPAVLLALDPSGKSLGVIWLLYLFWPLMHGAMKRYQHRHLAFGSLASHFDVPKRRFYKPYLASIGIALLGNGLATLIMVLIIYLTQTIDIAAVSDGGTWLALAAGAIMLYLTYLMTGPYLQVRVSNLVWSATSFPGMTVSSHLRARGFIWLQLVNTVLTILSLGLYRPFAVVRAYEYRLAHLTVTTTDGFEKAMASADDAVGASADGVADFLGVDLSW